MWLFRFIAAIMFGRRGVAPLTPAEASEGDSPGRFAPEQLQTAWAAITLFLIWVLSIYLVFLSPLEANAWIDRAPMIPIVVGAWVPVLTFFAYGAHRFRLPILAAFVLAMTLLGNVLPGLHDMRVLRQASESAPIQARQPTLDQALQWWRKANGCGPTLSIDLCPVRPIIVAAEGGASRAAFFTGSLLAHLDDLSSSAPGGGPQFARQLFAISTVSGSSLGAAVYAARLEEAGGAAWRPLDREVVDNVLWYKSAKDRGLRGLTSVPLPAAPTRKDIVQQILAGDFLSPAAAALSLDFWVPFHAKYWNPGDRTYFLEKSWEMRYADPSGDPRRKPAASGLERPLSSLAPEDGKWRPLLLFNGTSITTGRRIMTSTLHPLFLSPDDGDNAPPDQRTVEAVFRDAYDTYDLMCLPPEKPTTEACSCTRPANKSALEPLRIKNCDLRLSTAVSNSARFPLVSSHGDINSAANKLVDRIVDGGYFDYSGIVSAMELHAQIARIDNKLSPYVLFLTNDPGFNPQACKATDPNAPPTDELDVLRRPAAAASTPIRWQIFSSLAYPFDTLINARVARSEQAMAQSVLLNRYQNVKAGFDVSPKNLGDLRAGLQPYVSFDIVSVGARCNKEKQVQPIPMNWWLAMPTQAYLDQEMCAPHNRGSLAGVLSQLGPQPPPKPEAVHRERYERAKQRVDEACGATGVLPAASGRQTR